MQQTIRTVLLKYRTIGKCVCTNNIVVLYGSSIICSFNITFGICCRGMLQKKGLQLPGSFVIQVRHRVWSDCKHGRNFGDVSEAVLRVFSFVVKDKKQEVTRLVILESMGYFQWVWLWNSCFFCFSKLWNILLCLTISCVRSVTCSYILNESWIPPGGLIFSPMTQKD